MVDLAHISPDQKSMVIRGDAKYQFVYVNHQPTYVNRINQELADIIGDVYNGSVAHARILEIHTPLMQMIQETDLDKISIERVIPIMKDLITYDYAMFKDLMIILAAMLEAKDVEMKSNHIDFTIKCSDNIVALAEARKTATSINVQDTNTEAFDDNIIEGEDECDCGNSPT